MTLNQFLHLRPGTIIRFPASGHKYEVIRALMPSETQTPKLIVYPLGKVKGTEIELPFVPTLEVVS